MSFVARMIFFTSIGVAALASAGCGDVTLRSHTLGDDVVVDGRYDDWNGKLEFVEKANMSVGAQNDDTHLYVILVIGDREVQRNVMMSGMYLWFDAAGANDRQFGVHFPLGLPDAAETLMPGPTQRQGPAAMRERFEKESLAEAELIAADGSARVTRALANLPGVDIRTRNERGALVFEYRVPLAAAVDAPYGIGAAPGSAIGVGLVTPEIDMSAVREKRGNGPPPGGGRGGGGRGGPPGDGGRGGMGGGRSGMGGPPELPDPIKVWATLTLAGAETKSD